MALVSK